MVANHHHQLHLLALGEATHHATQIHTGTSTQLPTDRTTRHGTDQLLQINWGKSRFSESLRFLTNQDDIRHAAHLSFLVASARACRKNDTQT